MVGMSWSQASDAGAELPITLLVDGSQAGTVRALLSDTSNQFHSDDVLAALSPLLAETNLRTLEDAVAIARAASGTAYVGVECFSSAGLTDVFDTGTLTLAIAVPVPFRKTDVVRLSGSALAAGTDSPASFSAYANLRTDVAVWTDHQDPGTTSQGFPAIVSIEPVLNLGGWVLEGSATGSYPGDPSITLDYVRMVHDFPGAGLRLEAGTVQPPVMGLQSSLPLVALTAFSERAMDPLRLIEKGGKEEIYLENPATVTVFVNNVVVRRTAMAAGRHRFEDFNYSSGLNDVRIQVEEEGKAPAILRRSVAYDSRLLPVGTSSYSFALGALRSNLQTPLAQGYLLHGILPRLTAGAYAQTDSARALAGAEAISSLPVGNLRLDAGLSLKGFAISGFAGELEYRLDMATRGAFPSLGAGIGYRSSGFTLPGDALDTAAYSWQYWLNANQKLPWGFSLALGYSFRQGWDSVATRSASMVLTKTVARDFNLLLNLRAEMPDGLKPSLSASFSVTFMDRGGRVTASVQDALTEGNASASLQVRPKKRFDDIGFSAAVTLPNTLSGAAAGSLGASLTDRRFEAAVSDSHTGGAADGLYSNRLSFQADSAIVFADGVFAITRPVTDSFALVVPRKAMKDQRILVNNESDGPQAVAEKGRAAVLPSLSSYQPNTVILDAPDAPDGTELGEFRHLIVPGYRSGTVIGAGTDATVYVSGRLRGKDGKPLVYGSGSLDAVPGGGSGDNTPGIDFFTDETGFFEAYGVRPGNYMLSLTDSPAAKLKLLVPEGTSGKYALGDLTVPVGSQEH